MQDKDFNLERCKLKQYFKQLKVGMVKFDDIPTNYQLLLKKYYGVDMK